jgi:hypothetical protein
MVECPPWPSIRWSRRRRLLSQTAVGSISEPSVCLAAVESAEGPLDEEDLNTRWFAVSSRGVRQCYAIRRCNIFIRLVTNVDSLRLPESHNRTTCIAAPRWHDVFSSRAVPDADAVYLFAAWAYEECPGRPGSWYDDTGANSADDTAKRGSQQRRWDGSRRGRVAGRCSIFSSKLCHGGQRGRKSHCATLAASGLALILPLLPNVSVGSTSASNIKLPLEARIDLFMPGRRPHGSAQTEPSRSQQTAQAPWPAAEW